MGALFNDAPMIEHDDLVCIPYCTESVGNDEGRAPLHQFVHTFLYQCLRAGVDARGGLVEDKYGRI